MPRIMIDLPTDVSIALRRYAHEGDTSREAAAVDALRDWLLGHGYLEIVNVLDEETEVMGEA